ncbi:MAG: hypothetical protein PGN33_07075 [Methylobacterium radiotolerans]
MSYLCNTRLVFSGTFQADVSTVNNDVRHYDLATWEARFQEFQKRDGTEEGWWNPIGSGAFRLIGCRIGSVHYGDGTGTDRSEADPAVGMSIGGANERVAAKLVDLDPQWQMASQIWGLEVRLAAEGQPPVASGSFLPAAFRDLTMGRVQGPERDGRASSSFQSTLEGVRWSAGARASRALREIEELSGENGLSIRLMTFGYVGRYGDPRFSLGTVCGVIGPRFADEPKTFVRGRRFVAADAQSGLSWAGINYFAGSIDEGSSTLLLDLGNALPLLDAKGAVRDIGRLMVGILRDPSLAERAAVTPANFEPIGEIDYRSADWLSRTAGVCALRLTGAQMKEALGAPLALVAGQADGTDLIAIRESEGGLFSCAEEFVQRIDAPLGAADPPGRGTVVVHAARFGKPLRDAEIVLTVVPPQDGVGGGGRGAPNQPTATIPTIGQPATALDVPARVRSGEDGRAAVDIAVGPLGNPRGYVDGQIYLVAYAIDGEAPINHPQFDLIAVHARDGYAVPAKPAWIPDIAPIFTQYGNLYPIMSRRLVDLSDPASVMRNLKALKLAFSLDIGDPNHMPVTRDLSAAKRMAIRHWLDRLGTEGDPTFKGGPRAGPAPATGATAVAQAAGAVDPLGGKTTFARSLRRGPRS